MTPAQLATIATELSGDPLGLGLGGASDAEAADLLSANTRSVPRDIPLGAFQGLLVSRGRWAGLIQFAAGARPEGDAGLLWDAVIGLRDLIMAGQAKVIALTDPNDAGLFATQLAGLVAAGLIAAEDQAALLALGSRPGSRGEELGLGIVTPSDIADARRLIG